MANDDRVLWTRPADCTCGARLRGEELKDGTAGPLRLTREVRPECLKHGIAQGLMDRLLDAAQGVLRSVPGSPEMNRTQLRRLLEAALPILLPAVKAGLLDHLIPPPGAGTGPGPGTGGGTGTGDGTGGGLGGAEPVV